MTSLTLALLETDSSLVKMGGLGEPPAADGSIHFAHGARERSPPIRVTILSQDEAPGSTGRLVAMVSPRAPGRLVPDTDTAPRWRRGFLSL